MEHQIAGVRPTRLHRAVSQPVDQFESVGSDDGISDRCQAIAIRSLFGGRTPG